MSLCHTFCIMSVEHRQREPTDVFYIFCIGNIFPVAVQGNNEVSMWDMETGDRRFTLWASSAPPLSELQVWSFSFPLSVLQPGLEQPMLCISTVTRLHGLASLAPGTCPGIYFGTIIVLLSKLLPFVKQQCNLNLHWHFPLSVECTCNNHVLYPVMFLENQRAGQDCNDYGKAKIHGMTSCTYLLFLGLCVFL